MEKQIKDMYNISITLQSLLELMIYKSMGKREVSKIHIDNLVMSIVSEIALALVQSIVSEIALALVHRVVGGYKYKL